MKKFSEHSSEEGTNALNGRSEKNQTAVHSNDEVGSMEDIKSCIMQNEKIPHTFNRNPREGRETIGGIRSRDQITI